MDCHPNVSDKFSSEHGTKLTGSASDAPQFKDTLNQFIERHIYDPNISNAYGGEKDIIKKFNVTGWIVPKSYLDCWYMIMAASVYPTFIDDEDRCGKSTTESECSDTENLDKCWSFVTDPEQILWEYFN